jgi:hypothetical protein
MSVESSDPAVSAPSVPVLPICSPSDTLVSPQFVVPFRRFLPAGELKLALPEGGFNLACTRLGIDVTAGLDLRFDQAWTLSQLAVGDLSSTIVLAPLEQLTLEMQNTQRRVLEQTPVDSAEAHEAKACRLAGATTEAGACLSPALGIHERRRAAALAGRAQAALASLPGHPR